MNIRFVAKNMIHHTISDIIKDHGTVEPNALSRLIKEHETVEPKARGR